MYTAGTPCILSRLASTRCNSPKYTIFALGIFFSFRFAELVSFVTAQAAREALAAASSPPRRSSLSWRQLWVHGVTPSGRTLQLFLAQRIAVVKVEEARVQRLRRGLILRVVVGLPHGQNPWVPTIRDGRTSKYGCFSASSTSIRLFGLNVKHFSIRSIACERAHEPVGERSPRLPRHNKAKR